MRTLAIMLAMARPTVLPAAPPPSKPVEPAAMSQPATISAEDRAAIEAIIAEQDAAWAKGDAAGFVARVTPDVVFTNVVGMFTVGKAPMEAQHARIFATIYQGSTLSQEIVHVAAPIPDLAIVDTLTSGVNFRALPPGIEAIDGKVRTRLEQVMVKREGQWWVASFHNVAINPAFAPGAPPLHP